MKAQKLCFLFIALGLILSTSAETANAAQRQTPKAKKDAVALLPNPPAIPYFNPSQYTTDQLFHMMLGFLSSKDQRGCLEGQYTHSISSSLGSVIPSPSTL